MIIINDSVVVGVVVRVVVVVVVVVMKIIIQFGTEIKLNILQLAVV